MTTDPLGNIHPPMAMTRRNTITLLATAIAGGLTYLTSPTHATANDLTALQLAKDTTMTPKAFVYTEVQVSVPFDQAPWHEINKTIQQQPGFLNKTWLSGVKTNSLGGVYAFDSIENATEFVTGYFPREAASFGSAHNTRVFDAEIVREASLGLNSPHFGIVPKQKPGAFVYTEVQINVPFEKAPWRDRNPILAQQPGLIAKTWFSGVKTNTLGGLDAFDSLENATTFALQDFPKAAQKMNSAFYTRIFDATVTETASREMHSPYYV
ncbi:MAG: YdhR family protein [Alphaproteobacteria bacterium]|nr:YdhR family protein [Alphaproteobacteria bacterium]